MATLTKYAGLPDIDTAADVYETEDVAAISRGQNDSDSDDSLRRLRSVGSKPSATGVRKAAAEGEGMVDGSTLVPGKERVRKVFGRRERARNSGGEDAYTSRPRLPPISQRLAPRSTYNTQSYEPPADSLSDSTTSENENDDAANYLTARTSSLRIRETPQARLRRLQWEMSQLEKELEGQDDVGGAGNDAGDGIDTRPSAGRRKRKPQPSTAELLKTLGGLQSDATRLDQVASTRTGLKPVFPVGKTVQGIVGRLQQSATAPADVPVQAEESGRGYEVLSDGDQSTRALDAAELDKRLDLLEKRIGTGTVDETTLNQPILQSLQKLENVLGLLAQPRQLDAASRKVKLLLADLGKASALATGTGPTAIRGALAYPTAGKGFNVSPPEEEKLDALYNLLPRIEPILPILPPLLTRLRSLASLHANASSFQGTLQALEAETREMDSMGKEMTRVLTRVEEGLGRNADGVQRNWESLDRRLADIMRRLDVLDHE